MESLRQQNEIVVDDIGLLPTPRRPGCRRFALDELQSAERTALPSPPVPVLLDVIGRAGLAQALLRDQFCALRASVCTFAAA